MATDLVRQAQAGDHAAFDALIRTAYDRLFAIAHRILRDREAAEDATQDAIVRCWRDIRGLRDPDRFEAWLHRLLVNACRDLARRSRRRRAPIWSPDGSQFMFYLHGISDAFQHTPNEIYVINADGTDLTLLVDGPGFKGVYDWWE